MVVRGISMKLHYQKHLKPFSQKLRKGGNLSEVLLWNELKGSKLGYRFLRQRPVGRYIVDFYPAPFSRKTILSNTQGYSAGNPILRDCFSYENGAGFTVIR